MAPVVRNVHMEACCHALRNQVPMKALPGRYVCKFVVSLAIQCSNSMAVLCHKKPFPFPDFCIRLTHWAGQRVDGHNAHTSRLPTRNAHLPPCLNPRERERERNWHALLRGRSSMFTPLWSSWSSALLFEQGQLMPTGRSQCPMNKLLEW